MSVHWYERVHVEVCIGMSVYWYECEYVWVFIGMIVYMCAYFSHTTAQRQKPVWKASFQFVIFFSEKKKKTSCSISLSFLLRLVLLFVLICGP